MIEERRLALHKRLCEILGSNQVYYQAPVNVKMQYPAIVYELSYLLSEHADNAKYLQRVKYKVTFITKEANPKTLETLNNEFGFIFSTYYKADGLNHFTFNIII